MGSTPQQMTETADLSQTPNMTLAVERDVILPWLNLNYLLLFGGVADLSNNEMVE